ncbi:MAG: hypothetical protein PHW02_03030 [bacterium]|nr:hypothetical protein [bacterium]
MKRIISILLLFINIIPLYAGWPVEFNYGKIISDVFWSSRGTDGWHEGD